MKEIAVLEVWFHMDIITDVWQAGQDLNSHYLRLERRVLPIKLPTHFGCPGWIRTSDLRFIGPMLYH